MKLFKKFMTCAAFLCAIALCGPSGNIQAQTAYPTKPVTLVVPFSPGSTTDLASRALSNAVKTLLPEPLVVVNRPGATGVIASTYVAQAPPDGYTLLASRVSCNGIIPALNKTIKYAIDDFTFLGILEINPFVFVVPHDAPYKTLQDLADAIAKNPGALSYSTAGAQSMLEIVGFMFLDAANLPNNAAVSVPFKGDGDAKTALLGGHVSFIPSNLTPVMDQIQSGNFRALAITTPKRLPSLPDVPTVREAGFPLLENAVGWTGLWAPKNTPAHVVKAWSEILQKVGQDQEWNTIVTNLGSIPYILSPEDTKNFVDEQYNKFTSLGKKLNIIITGR